MTFKMSTSIELGLPENMTKSNNIILNNNIAAVSFFKFALSPYHTRKVHYLYFRVTYTYTHICIYIYIYTHIYIYIFAGPLALGMVRSQ